MTLSMTVSKSTALLGTRNPVTTPLFICSALSHTPSSPNFLTALKGHFVEIWGFCVEVLRLHTSLSFGITTEKQHSHLHEKSNVGLGGVGGVRGVRGRVWGTAELHAGKRSRRKQTTMPLFTHTNNPHLSSSCDKSSWVESRLAPKPDGNNKTNPEICIFNRKSKWSLYTGSSF